MSRGFQHFSNCQNRRYDAKVIPSRVNVFSLVYVKLWGSSFWDIRVQSFFLSSFGVTYFHQYGAVRL